MDRVYIAWSTENLITVTIMAALGYVAFATLWQILQYLRGNRANA